MPATMSWRLPSAWTVIIPEETAPTSGKSRAGPTAISLPARIPGAPGGADGGEGAPTAFAVPAGNGVDDSGAPRRHERTDATQPAASHVAPLVSKPLRIPNSKQ